MENIPSYLLLKQFIYIETHFNSGKGNVIRCIALFAFLIGKRRKTVSSYYGQKARF